MQVIARGECEYFDGVSSKIEISTDIDIKLDNVITRLTYAKKILDEIEYIFSKRSFEIYKYAQIDCRKFESSSQEMSDYWDMLISNGTIKFTRIDLTADNCATVFAENDIYSFIFQICDESIVGMGCRQK